MRTAGSRRSGNSRVYSMKPVTFPMVLSSLVGRGKRLPHVLARDAEDAFVFPREDLDELGQHVLPVFQHPLAPRAARSLHVAIDDSIKQIDFFRRDRLQIHRRGIAAL